MQSIMPILAIIVVLVIVVVAYRVFFAPEVATWCGALGGWRAPSPLDQPCASRPLRRSSRVMPSASGMAMTESWIP